MPPTTTVSGHINLRKGTRGGVWYAKWRDATGRQREKRLAKDWTDKGQPVPGYMRRKEANAALQAILTDARRGLIEQVRSTVTFASVAEEWFENGKLERDWTPATKSTYRSALDVHLLPEFGALRIESIKSARIKRWRDKKVSGDGMQRRQANMMLALLHGIFKYAEKPHGLVVNPTDDVSRLRESYDSARYDFYTPEEIQRLADHTEDEQDGIAFKVAAFTGIRRGELVALLWEDIDFKNHSIRVWEQIDRTGERDSTKSRRSRTVPMIDQAAEALTSLKERGYVTRPKDPVFLGESGGAMDASALRRRYIKARDDAKLRPLRFHDLRHTFGSLAINFASIVQVQAWMGHAKVTTTMRYLHHKNREDDARLLSAAFRANADHTEEDAEAEAETAAAAA
jgi:integrase